MFLKFCSCNFTLDADYLTDLTAYYWHLYTIMIWLGCMFRYTLAQRSTFSTFLSLPCCTQLPHPCHCLGSIRPAKRAETPLWHRKDRGDDAMLPYHGVSFQLDGIWPGQCFQTKLITSLSQWLNFKLSGITCLVGKIKFKLFSQGSIGWVSYCKFVFIHVYTLFAEDSEVQYFSIT